MEHSAESTNDTGRRTAPSVLVGVAGWSYEDWNGVVYGGAERDKLKFLSDYLDCIEINTSFYRPVRAPLAERWLSTIEPKPEFRFTAKLWQRFTHATDQPFSASDVETFKEGLSPLHDAGRLLALLVQFPFFFRDSQPNRDLLKRISGSFADYTKVLEVRDRSWSEPDALEFIRRLDYNIACLDMPLTKNSFRAEAAVTGHVGYLRLHGRNSKAWFSKDAGRDQKYDYLYSDAEMDELFERLRKIRDRAESVVMIWNNHFRGKAVANAVQSLSRLKGKRVPVPPLLKMQYPELDAIALPESGQLF